MVGTPAIILCRWAWRESGGKQVFGVRGTFMRKIDLGSIVALALVIATPAQAGLFGLPKFKVEQSDDRFSADGLTTYSGLYNRISKKSLAGGVHIDDKGVFIEPFAVKNRASGVVVALSFFIHNEADYSTNYGSPLTLGAPQRITFITGEGGPIALPIKRGDSKWSSATTYNSITRSASAAVTETGFADLTAEQYQRIINATALAVRIEGTERSMTYETRDIAKTFVPNLKTFYEQYVAK